MGYLIFQALKAEGSRRGYWGAKSQVMLPHGDSGGQRPAGSQHCAGLRGAEGRTRDQRDGGWGAVSAQSREAQGPHPSFFLQRHAGPARSSEAEQDHTCRPGVCRERGGGQCSVEGAKGDRGWESFLQSRIIAFLGPQRKRPEPQVSTNSESHQDAVQHIRDLN